VPASVTVVTGTVDVVVVALTNAVVLVDFADAVVVDFAEVAGVLLPENAATPPSAANSAMIATAERPFPPPVDMTTSLPLAAVLSTETNSRSGASSGFPHALQNAAEPLCTSPHEKHERRRTTMRLYRY
jgi:hypothetical protein